ncbi:MAG: chorismate synthase [Candidatus Thermoplasmatota archaeon]|jgi:chorismate synthase|nr:chorismate synthase [Candidatus Thermoplasmatota archaeon]
MFQRLPMMRFGHTLSMTLTGTSHGPQVGVIVEGIPPGTPIDAAAIQRELDRRRPYGRRLATMRKEEDRLILHSGVREAKATGDPIVAYVENLDVKRGPYAELEDVPRPGHADYPARARWGNTRDLSGGGIFSGRMTVGIVIAGALARGLLSPKGIEAVAYTRSIGNVEVPPETLDLPLSELARRSQGNEVGAPDEDAAARMATAIEETRREGDSLGGIVEVQVAGMPVGVGEPFFDSLESVLSHAYFSIPAVKGVEFGAGFRSARMRGSEHNDAFLVEEGRVRTRTNHAGGILGGLSDGMPLVARVVVKPTSSIPREQDSVSLSRKEPVRLVVKGRHDPCIVPRAVPVVENFTAFVVADLMKRGGFL